MQSSRLVRSLAAAASILIVALALMGARFWTGGSSEPVTALAVGVPTGEYVNGIEVQRLPSITVTARRSDAK